ncbi:MAG: hypothetical protein K9J37_14520 [Saprospiraceae bacterium]|nr:hypothetical protein [Saprospiraceae bacterium]MCF8251121.1 hypothetical protein [Saprospiraceae bacterium]MCF8282967.1 hypothetical protein [Bacteroidales bacterium]MCF8312921.1 hypothetical protein [Saprospiraceae bacterium]MCF8441380.1 hypothetical protein [Saprospiraceae bacterium]
MKNFIFAFVAVATLLFACKKDDNSNTKTVQLKEVFSLKVNQTAELSSEDWKITLLEITEDSRCPSNADCFWAGRVIAEFKVEKAGESLIKTLTDNPENDPTLSTSFTAFGHLVKLNEVTPYPDGSPIAQKDYVVEIEIE